MFLKKCDGQILLDWGISDYSSWWFYLFFIAVHE